MQLTLLNIKGTEDTPEIVFNPEIKEVTISGRSLPEDVTSFYKPVFEWLDELTSAAEACKIFKFKLEYFNTASSKIILDILMKLEELREEMNAGIEVQWLYEENDDDMLEAGEEYKDLIEIPFTLVKH